MKRLEEKEQLLVQCKKDFEKMLQIHDELKKIESNRKELEFYYKNEYVKDYELATSNIKNYRVLDQDSIWNTLDEQYHEKIKILKTIIQSI